MPSWRWSRAEGVRALHAASGGWWPRWRGTEAWEGARGRGSGGGAAPPRRAASGRPSTLSASVLAPVASSARTTYEGIQKGPG